METILEYRLAADGKVMVREGNGAERLASAKEWLAIWLVDPTLTLRLAA